MDILLYSYIIILRRWHVHLSPFKVRWRWPPPPFKVRKGLTTTSWFNHLNDYIIFPEDSIDILCSSNPTWLYLILPYYSIKEMACQSSTVWKKELEMATTRHVNKSKMEMATTCLLKQGRDWPPHCQCYDTFTWFYYSLHKLFYYSIVISRRWCVNLPPF